MATGIRTRWAVAPLVGLVLGAVLAGALRGTVPGPVRHLASTRAPVSAPSASVPKAVEVGAAVAAAARSVATRTSAAGAAIRSLPGETIRDAVERWLASEPGVRAVTVGVARPSTGRTWTGAVARPGAAPPPVDARYPALSVTKTFVAALVLREARVGRLALDAPVPQVPGLPPSPATTPAITPRMLLRHTSGLVDYHFARGYDRAAAVTPTGLVTLGLGSPLLGTPGGVARYSNTNYHWLGLVLEHVSGRPLASLVDELAREVGLDHTSLSAPDRPGWTGFASGGVVSTAGDLARWAAALFAPGRVLHPDDLRLLVDVGPWGASHGLWPVCPCSETSPPAGVAQLVADGGVVHHPAEDVAVVVHLPAGGPRAHQQATALAAAIRDALGAAGVATGSNGGSNPPGAPVVDGSPPSDAAGGTPVLDLRN